MLPVLVLDTGLLATDGKLRCRASLLEISRPRIGAPAGAAIVLVARIIPTDSPETTNITEGSRRTRP